MPEDAGTSTAQPAPSFGGLSPAEAAKKRWDKERERPKQGAGSKEGGIDRRAELEKLVAKGGMVAIQALRDLAQIEREATPTVDVFALLTSEQREIVRGWLKDAANEGKG